MKRFEYLISIRKQVVIYADTDLEAYERAMQEEIVFDDCVIMDKEPAQPEPKDR